MTETSTSIMRYLAHRFFNGECFVTHEKYKDIGFVIHHLKYIQNDVRRDQFPKGEKGRFEYLKKLKPMVENQPFRFILIKNGIHTRIDHPRRGLSRLKRENFIRLVVAVLLTEK